jgi:small subunit ribosomal protein S20
MSGTPGARNTIRPEPESALLPCAFAPGARPAPNAHSARLLRGPPLAKTPRTWTGARTPSGLKRVRQAERRREILQPRRTVAKTLVAKAIRVATEPTDGQDPQAALIEALSALDRAAKVGAIHPNAAARRKSRLTIKINDALGGFAVQPSARVAKTTGKAQAAKAAKARIAASKADKAKGAQTAAGKARAALSKTTRAEAAKATPAATASTTASKTPRATKTAASASRTKATAGESKAKTTRATAKKTTKS